MNRRLIIYLFPLALFLSLVANADDVMITKKAVVTDSGSVYVLFEDKFKSKYFVGRYEVQGDELKLVELVTFLSSSGSGLKLKDISPNHRGFVVLGNETGALPEEKNPSGGILGLLEAVRHAPLKTSNQAVIIRVANGKQKRKIIDLTYDFSDSVQMLHRFQNGNLGFVYNIEREPRYGVMNPSGAFNKSHSPNETTVLYPHFLRGGKVIGTPTNIIELPGKAAAGRQLQVGFQVEGRDATGFWLGIVSSQYLMVPFDKEVRFRVPHENSESRNSPQLKLAATGREVYVVQDSSRRTVSITKHSLLPEGNPTLRQEFDWVMPAGSSTGERYEHTLQVLADGSLVMQGVDAKNDVVIVETDSNFRPRRSHSIKDIGVTTCGDLMRQLNGNSSSL